MNIRFNPLRSSCSAFLRLICLLTAAVCYSQENSGQIRLDFYHQGYVIHDENDGSWGRGVDLYLGWVVEKETEIYGGSSEPKGGLTNANGQPVNPDGTGNRKIHRWHELAFSIVIPANQVAKVRLHLIESDHTTDEIRARFKEAKLPVFSTVRDNTDDDYGFWCYEFANLRGKKLITTLVNSGSSAEKSKVEATIVMPECPVDGKPHDLFHSAFNDPGNCISPSFEVVVSEVH